MGNLTCTRCAASIAADDVNVGEGVAFCRACSSVIHLTELAGEPDTPEVVGADPAVPPDGCAVSGDGAHMVIRTTCRSMAGAIGTFAVAAFWNGILSVFLVIVIGGTLHHILGSLPSWFPAPQSGSGAPFMPLGMVLFMWIFLTPFIMVGTWLAMACLLCLGGKVEVRVRGVEGIVFTGVGPLGIRKRFDASAVEKVAISQTKFQQNGQSRPLIELTAAGRAVRFGTNLSDDRRAWMIATLRALLLSPKPRR